MTTFERVRNVLAGEFDRAAESVTVEARLVEDLGMDSLDRIELVFAIEDEFRIQVDEMDVKDLATVGEIVTFVDSAKVGPK